jgi:hypothetical protein
VFEGTVDGNLSSLEAMERVSKNPKVHFLAVNGASHFSILAPTTKLLAQRILRDTGPQPGITFTADELNRPFGR